MKRLQMCVIIVATAATRQDTSAQCWITFLAQGTMGITADLYLNETVAPARTGDVPATLLDCEKDVLAAMNYAKKVAIKNRYILFGSSFSVSPALKAVGHRRKAVTVVAFSPGEYFGSTEAKNWLKDFDRPIYVASTRHTQPFIDELAQKISTHSISSGIIRWTAARTEHLHCGMTAPRRAKAGYRS